MSDRLQPMTIRISSSTITDVVEMVKAAGLDPYKAAEIPIVATMVKMYDRGELDRATFLSNLNKILIMNPQAALK